MVKYLKLDLEDSQIFSKIHSLEKETEELRNSVTMRQTRNTCKDLGSSRSLADICKPAEALVMVSSYLRNEYHSPTPSRFLLRLREHLSGCPVVVSMLFAQGFQEKSLLQNHF